MTPISIMFIYEINAKKNGSSARMILNKHQEKKERKKEIRGKIDTN
jgi:hypothetical protein